MSEQMQKIHDKIAECDREAALRGFSDTGFPRLWFSALSRVAGLELARPPQSKCVNLGDGSIPSPVTRDTSPAICELQQQNDELRAEVARLREERHNGTELGHLLRSAQVTIPQELKALDPQCQKYAAGWNDCLHNVKAMLAGKITVNQQTGAIKVMKEGP